MSFHSIILPLCMVLMTVFGSIACYFIMKSISLSKQLASEKLARTQTTTVLIAAFGLIKDLRRVGHEMYLELEEKADKAAYLGHLVPCLKEKISHLVSHIDSMNAKRLAEEKRELGAYIVELLISVFSPGPGNLWCLREFERKLPGATPPLPIGQSA
jgi:hypothetical protein